jgi:hypothetical protein
LSQQVARQRTRAGEAVVLGGTVSAAAAAAAAADSQQRTCTQRLCPGWAAGRGYRRLRTLVHSPLFERAMHAVIILNAILILGELRFEYNPRSSAGGGGAHSGGHEAHGSSWSLSWWEVAELLFTALYIVEVVVKVTVQGWRRYWRLSRNKFDCAVSFASLGAEVVLLVPWIYNDPALIRFILGTRLLRTLRLLSDLPQFRHIFAAFFDLVPAFSRLVAVLYLIMCLFGQLAIPAFGVRSQGGTALHCNHCTHCTHCDRGEQLARSSVLPTAWLSWLIRLPR